MDLKLKATKRTAVGRQVRKLRAEGAVPAVVYGHRTDAESVALDGAEFRRVYAKAGRTHLVDLVLDGKRSFRSRFPSPSSATRRRRSSRARPT